MNNRGVVPVFLVVVGAIFIIGWFMAGQAAREDRKNQIADVKH